MTAPRVGLLQFAMLASVLAAGVEPPSFITPPRRPPEPEPPRPPPPPVDPEHMEGWRHRSREDARRRRQAERRRAKGG